MFSLFTWLRTRVRDSILAGVNDALTEWQDPGADLAQATAVLRDRLTALPPPATNGSPSTVELELSATADAEDLTGKTRSRRGRKDSEPG